MATQIRKFEQDAIVNSIVDKVEKSLKDKTRELSMKDKTYKAMLSEANEVKAIKKEIQNLSDKKDKMSAKLYQEVKLYNADLNTYNLSFDKWNGVLSVSPQPNSYQLKHEIANKVAISLLPKDAIDNIDAIISNIAKEFV
jgi:hypothetical protein